MKFPLFFFGIKSNFKKLVLFFGFTFLVGAGTFISFSYADTIQDFLDSLATKDLALQIEGNAAFEQDVYVGENVGIGTSDPTEKLTVDGVIETTEGVKFADGLVQTGAVMIASMDEARLGIDDIKMMTPFKTQASMNEVAILFGESIDGTTTPKAVCINASGEIEIADADVPANLNVIGFVNENVSVSTTGNVVRQGILDGFSALTAGSAYYLTDTAGEISPTPGTAHIQVGTAISSEELLIDINLNIPNSTVGIGTWTAPASGTQTITHGLGKIPTSIEFEAVGETGLTKSSGFVDKSGSQKCVNNVSTTADNSTHNYAIYIGYSSRYTRGRVRNITETSFDIVWTYKSTGYSDIYFTWKANL